MSRFQITGVYRARKPIIVLAGTILEGEVQNGDQLIVPLRDDTEFVGTVMGILHGLQMYESASFEDELQEIGIGVWRSDCHEFRDVLCGLATKVQD